MSINVQALPCSADWGLHIACCRSEIERGGTWNL